MEENISRKKSMEIESIARQNKGIKWYSVAICKSTIMWIDIMDNLNNISVIFL